MAVDDLGVVLGMAGIATGLVSIVYARTQASATRRQALEAGHMTVLAANQQIAERIASARGKLGESPHLLAEMRATTPGVFAAVDAAGGWRDYMLLRETMELFQQTFFLRRDGLVNDSLWGFTVANASIWARLPSFSSAFEAAVAHRLLHADFVAAFRPALGQGALRDPRPVNGP